MKENSILLKNYVNEKIPMQINADELNRIKNILTTKHGYIFNYEDDNLLVCNCDSQVIKVDKKKVNKVSILGFSHWIDGVDIIEIIKSDSTVLKSKINLLEWNNALYSLLSFGKFLTTESLVMKVQTNSFSFNIFEQSINLNCTDIAKIIFPDNENTKILAIKIECED